MKQLTAEPPVIIFRRRQVFKQRDVMGKKTEEHQPGCELMGSLNKKLKPNPFLTPQGREKSGQLRQTN